MSSSSSPYVIEPLSERWFEKTATLLTAMWNLPVEETRLRLRWKYLECPMTQVPLFFVVVSAGEVVASLGFFPSPFRVGNRIVKVVCPGDGYVSPEHRRFGLYTKLFLKGHEELAGHYNFFISLSANPVSAAGLVKIGWRSMSERGSLSTMQVWPTIRYLAGRAPKGRNCEGLVEGADGIANLYEELPASVHAIFEGCVPSPDGAYVRWRYSNPTDTYIAIPLRQEGKLLAFATCMVTRRDAFLLDFREHPGADALEPLVKIMRKRLAVPRFHFNGSIFDEKQQEALRRAGVRDYRPLLNVFLSRPPVPVLIHPTRKDATEADWHCDGLDMSRAEHWRIPEFCNDGY
jgi:hypothetical protein